MLSPAPFSLALFHSVVHFQGTLSDTAVSAHCGTSSNTTGVANHLIGAWGWCIKVASTFLYDAASAQVLFRSRQVATAWLQVANHTRSVPCTMEAGSAAPAPYAWAMPAGGQEVLAITCRVPEMRVSSRANGLPLHYNVQAASVRLQLRPVLGAWSVEVAPSTTAAMALSAVVRRGLFAMWVPSGTQQVAAGSSGDGFVRLAFREGTALHLSARIPALDTNFSSLTGAFHPSAQRAAGLEITDEELTQVWRHANTTLAPALARQAQLQELPTPTELRICDSGMSLATSAAADAIAWYSAVSAVRFTGGSGSVGVSPSCSIQLLPYHSVAGTSSVPVSLANLGNLSLVLAPAAASATVATSLDFQPALLLAPMASDDRLAQDVTLVAHSRYLVPAISTAADADFRLRGTQAAVSLVLRTWTSGSPGQWAESVVVPARSGRVPAGAVFAAPSTSARLTGAAPLVWLEYTAADVLDMRSDLTAGGLGMGAVMMCFVNVLDASSVGGISTTTPTSLGQEGHAVAALTMADHTVIVVATDSGVTMHLVAHDTQAEVSRIQLASSTVDSRAHGHTTKLQITAFRAGLQVYWQSTASDADSGPMDAILTAYVLLDATAGTLTVAHTATAGMAGSITAMQVVPRASSAAHTLMWVDGALNKIEVYVDLRTPLESLFPALFKVAGAPLVSPSTVTGASSLQAAIIGLWQVSINAPRLYMRATASDTNFGSVVRILQPASSSASILPPFAIESARITAADRTSKATLTTTVVYTGHAPAMPDTCTVRVVNLPDQSSVGERVFGAVQSGSREQVQMTLGGSNGIAHDVEIRVVCGGVVAARRVAHACITTVAWSDVQYADTVANAKLQIGLATAGYCTVTTAVQLRVMGMTHALTLEPAANTTVTLPLSATVAGTAPSTRVLLLFGSYSAVIGHATAPHMLGAAPQDSVLVAGSRSFITADTRDSCQAAGCRDATVLQISLTSATALALSVQTIMGKILAGVLPESSQLVPRKGCGGMCGPQDVARCTTPATGSQSLGISSSIPAYGVCQVYFSVAATSTSTLSSTVTTDIALTPSGATVFGSTLRHSTAVSILPPLSRPLPQLLGTIEGTKRNTSIGQPVWYKPQVDLSPAPMLMLSSDVRFTEAVEVVAVRLTATHAPQLNGQPALQGKITFAILRPTTPLKDSSLRFVGDVSMAVRAVVSVSVPANDSTTVALPTPLEAQAGDFLAWYAGPQNSARVRYSDVKPAGDSATGLWFQASEMPVVGKTMELIAGHSAGQASSRRSFALAAVVTTLGIGSVSSSPLVLARDSQRLLVSVAHPAYTPDNTMALDTRASGAATSAAALPFRIVVSMNATASGKATPFRWQTDLQAQIAPRECALVSIVLANDSMTAILEQHRVEELNPAIDASNFLRTSAQLRVQLFSDTDDLLQQAHVTVADLFQRFRTVNLQSCPLARAKSVSSVPTDVGPDGTVLKGVNSSTSTQLLASTTGVTYVQLSVRTICSVRRSMMTFVPTCNDAPTAAITAEATSISFYPGAEFRIWVKSLNDRNQDILQLRWFIVAAPEGSSVSDGSTIQPMFANVSSDGDATRRASLLATSAKLTSASESPAVTFAADVGGQYTVGLEVSDGCSTRVVELTVEVLCGLPQTLAVTAVPDNSESSGVSVSGAHAVQLNAKPSEVLLPQSDSARFTYRWGVNGFAEGLDSVGYSVVLAPERSTATSLAYACVIGTNAAVADSSSVQSTSASLSEAVKSHWTRLSASAALGMRTSTAAPDSSMAPFTTQAWQYRSADMTMNIDSSFVSLRNVVRANMQGYFLLHNYTSASATLEWPATHACHLPMSVQLSSRDTCRPDELAFFSDTVSLSCGREPVPVANSHVSVEALPPTTVSELFQKYDAAGYNQTLVWIQSSSTLNASILSDSLAVVYLDGSQSYDPDSAVVRSVWKPLPPTDRSVSGVSPDEALSEVTVAQFMQRNSTTAVFLPTTAGRFGFELTVEDECFRRTSPSVLVYVDVACRDLEAGIVDPLSGALLPVTQTITVPATLGNAVRLTGYTLPKGGVFGSSSAGFALENVEVTAPLTSPTVNPFLRGVSSVEMEAVTAAWQLIQAPQASDISSADLALLNGTFATQFTPDVDGTYELEFVVTAVCSGTVHRQQVVVEVGCRNLNVKLRASLRGNDFSGLNEVQQINVTWLGSTQGFPPLLLSAAESTLDDELVSEAILDDNHVRYGWSSAPVVRNEQALAINFQLQGGAEPLVWSFAMSDGCTSLLPTQRLSRVSSIRVNPVCNEVRASLGLTVHGAVYDDIVQTVVLDERTSRSHVVFYNGTAGEFPVIGIEGMTEYTKVFRGLEPAVGDFQWTVVQPNSTQQLIPRRTADIAVDTSGTYAIDSEFYDGCQVYREEFAIESRCPEFSVTLASAPGASTFTSWDIRSSSFLPSNLLEFTVTPTYTNPAYPGTFDLPASFTTKDLTFTSASRTADSQVYARAKLIPGTDNGDGCSAALQSITVDPVLGEAYAFQSGGASVNIGLCPNASNMTTAELSEYASQVQMLQIRLLEEDPLDIMKLYVSSRLVRCSDRYPSSDPRASPIEVPVLQSNRLVLTNYVVHISVRPDIVPTPSAAISAQFNFAFTDVCVSTSAISMSFPILDRVDLSKSDIFLAAAAGDFVVSATVSDGCSTVRSNSLTLRVSCPTYDFEVTRPAVGAGSPTVVAAAADGGFVAVTEGLRQPLAVILTARVLRSTDATDVTTSLPVLVYEYAAAPSGYTAGDVLASDKFTADEATFETNSGVLVDGSTFGVTNLTFSKPQTAVTRLSLDDKCRTLQSFQFPVTLQCIQPVLDVGFATLNDTANTTNPTGTQTVDVAYDETNSEFNSALLTVGSTYAGRGHAFDLLVGLQALVNDVDILTVRDEQAIDSLVTVRVAADNITFAESGRRQLLLQPLIAGEHTVVLRFNDGCAIVEQSVTLRADNSCISLVNSEPVVDPLFATQFNGSQWLTAPDPVIIADNEAGAFPELRFPVPQFHNFSRNLTTVAAKWRITAEAAYPSTPAVQAAEKRLEQLLDAVYRTTPAATLPPLSYVPEMAGDFSVQLLVSDGCELRSTEIRFTAECGFVVNVTTDVGTSTWNGTALSSVILDLSGSQTIPSSARTLQVLSVTPLNSSMPWAASLESEQSIIDVTIPATGPDQLKPTVLPSASLASVLPSGAGHGVRVRVVMTDGCSVMTKDLDIPLRCTDVGDASEVRAFVKQSTAGAAPTTSLDVVAEDLTGVFVDLSLDTTLRPLSSVVYNWTILEQPSNPLTPEQRALVDEDLRPAELSIAQAQSSQVRGVRLSVPGTYKFQVTVHNGCAQRIAAVATVHILCGAHNPAAVVRVVAGRLTYDITTRSFPDFTAEMYLFNATNGVTVVSSRARLYYSWRTTGSAARAIGNESTIRLNLASDLGLQPPKTSSQVTLPLEAVVISPCLHVFRTVFDLVAACPAVYSQAWPKSTLAAVWNPENGFEATVAAIFALQSTSGALNAQASIVQGLLAQRAPRWSIRGLDAGKDVAGPRDEMCRWYLVQSATELILQRACSTLGANQAPHVTSIAVAAILPASAEPTSAFPTPSGGVLFPLRLYGRLSDRILADPSTELSSAELSWLQTFDDELTLTALVDMGCGQPVETAIAVQFRCAALSQVSTPSGDGVLTAAVRMQFGGMRGFGGVSLALGQVVQASTPADARFALYGDWSVQLAPTASAFQVGQQHVMSAAFPAVPVGSAVRQVLRLNSSTEIELTTSSALARLSLTAAHTTVALGSIQHDLQFVPDVAGMYHLNFTATDGCPARLSTAGSPSLRPVQRQLRVDASCDLPPVVPALLDLMVPKRAVTVSAFNWQRVQLVDVAINTSRLDNSLLEILGCDTVEVIGNSSLGINQTVCTDEDSSAIRVQERILSNLTVLFSQTAGGTVQWSQLKAPPAVARTAGHAEIGGIRSSNSLLDASFVPVTAGEYEFELRLQDPRCADASLVYTIAIDVVCASDDQVLYAEPVVDKVQSIDPTTGLLVGGPDNNGSMYLQSLGAGEATYTFEQSRLPLITLRSRRITLEDLEEKEEESLFDEFRRRLQSTGGSPGSQTQDVPFQVTWALVAQPDAAIPTFPPTPGSSSNRLSAGIIAAIVIACLVLLCFFCICCALLIHQRRNKNDDEESVYEEHEDRDVEGDQTSIVPGASAGAAAGAGAATGAGNSAHSVGDADANTDAAARVRSRTDSRSGDVQDQPGGCCGVLCCRRSRRQSRAPDSTRAANAKPLDEEEGEAGNGGQGQGEVAVVNVAHQGGRGKPPLSAGSGSASGSGHQPGEADRPMDNSGAPPPVVTMLNGSSEAGPPAKLTANSPETTAEEAGDSMQDSRRAAGGVPSPAFGYASKRAASEDILPSDLLRERLRDSAEPNANASLPISDSQLEGMPGLAVPIDQEGDEEQRAGTAYSSDGRGSSAGHAGRSISALGTVAGKKKSLGHGDDDRHPYSGSKETSVIESLHSPSSRKPLARTKSAAAGRGKKQSHFSSPKKTGKSQVAPAPVGDDDDDTMAGETPDRSALAVAGGVKVGGITSTMQNWDGDRNRTNTMETVAESADEGTGDGAKAIGGIRLNKLRAAGSKERSPNGETYSPGPLDSPEDQTEPHGAHSSRSSQLLPVTAAAVEKGQSRTPKATSSSLSPAERYNNSEDDDLLLLAAGGRGGNGDGGELVAKPSRSTRPESPSGGSVWTTPERSDATDEDLDSDAEQLAPSPTGTGSANAAAAARRRGRRRRRKARGKGSKSPKKSSRSPRRSPKTKANARRTASPPPARDGPVFHNGVVLGGRSRSRSPHAASRGMTSPPSSLSTRNNGRDHPRSPAAGPRPKPVNTLYYSPMPGEFKQKFLPTPQHQREVATAAVHGKPTPASGSASGDDGHSPARGRRSPAAAGGRRSPSAVGSSVLRTASHHRMKGDRSESKNGSGDSISSRTPGPRRGPSGPDRNTARPHSSPTGDLQGVYVAGSSQLDDALTAAFKAAESDQQSDGELPLTPLEHSESATDFGLRHVAAAVDQSISADEPAVLHVAAAGVDRANAGSSASADPGHGAVKGDDRALQSQQTSRTRKQAPPRSVSTGQSLPPITNRSRPLHPPRAPVTFLGGDDADTQDNVQQIQIGNGQWGMRPPKVATGSEKSSAASGTLRAPVVFTA